MTSPATRRFVAALAGIVGAAIGAVVGVIVPRLGFSATGQLSGPELNWSAWFAALVIGAPTGAVIGAALAVRLTRDLRA